MIEREHLMPEHAAEQNAQAIPPTETPAEGNRSIVCTMRW
jgi:hypothetical protein